MNILKYFKQKEKQPVPTNIKLTTTHPPIKMSYRHWCKEFNVSMLWDKKAVCMD